VISDLKTLNDIYKETCDGCIAYNDLQDAAREWISFYREKIKHYEHLSKEYEAEDLLEDRPACARPDFTKEIMTYRGLIAGFKHFFNLEDEDV